MNQKSIGDRLQQAWMNNLLIAVNVLVFAVGMAGTGRWRDPGSLYRAGALYAPLLLKDYQVQPVWPQVLQQLRQVFEDQKTSRN